MSISQFSTNSTLPKYKVIYIDPPWKYDDTASAGKRGAVYKYPVLSLNDLKKLKLKEIADDDCAMFMWVTFPQLEVALELIKAYGFKFKTVAFCWVKLNKKKQTPFIGMGRWTRSNAEICLFATRGKPKRVSAAVQQIIMSPIEKHSKKPDETRNRIVDLVGDVPRIELFARESISGWTSVGNEVDGKDISERLEEIISLQSVSQTEQGTVP